MKKLRVLHIGNIANNAYNFSRALNSSGVVSDVICWDYYHIMGSPEWEECYFEQSPQDQFFPDWSEAGIKYFMHPEWYIQGPMKWTIRYLISKNNGSKLKQAWYRFLCYTYRKFQSSKHTKQTFRLLCNVRGKLNGRNVRLLEQVDFEKLRGAVAFIIFYITLLALSALYASILLARNCKRSYKNLRSFFSAVSINVINFLYESAAVLNPSARRAIKLFYKCLKTNWTAWLPKTIAYENSRVNSSDIDRINNLLREYNLNSPAEFKISNAETNQFLPLLPNLKKLFSSYDVIVGYATDGIFPLLSGYKYFCLEHGTIRNLPFQNSLQGRLCRMTYLNAMHVFITNCDNNVAAKKMGVVSYSFIPHPTNENWLPNSESNINETRAPFVIFHPPRHHWDESVRNSDWDKGNDRLIRAIARLVNEDGHDIKLITVNLGQTVKKSIELIEKLGLKARTTWINPAPHRKMLEVIVNSDLVADQFNVPSFGGIPPKSLMCGTPVLTSFDDTMHQWCFKTMPPFIRCTSEDDSIYFAIKECLENRKKIQNLRVSSMEWYAENYSMRCVIKEFYRVLNKYDKSEHNI